MANDLKIYNYSKFDKYTEIEQKLFFAFRNAQLLLMPKMDENGDIDNDKGNYEDDAIIYSENYAFKIVDEYPEELKNPQIQFQKIEELLKIFKNSLTPQTNTLPTTQI